MAAGGRGRLHTHLLIALAMASARADHGAAEELATVILMRHGEKDSASGNALSAEGIARAQYIAQCLKTDEPTGATPLGPVRAVVASATREGKSHRTRDTVRPLADARGIAMDDTIDKKDFAGLARVVRASLANHGTTVVSWQNEDLPALLRTLAPELRVDDSFTYWPRHCDAASWPEPKHLKGHNKCYDLIWRLTLARPVGGGAAGWGAVRVDALHMGFGGSASSPCAEGFAPLRSEASGAGGPVPTRGGGAAGSLLHGTARSIAAGDAPLF